MKKEDIKAAAEKYPVTNSMTSTQQATQYDRREGFIAGAEWMQSNAWVSFDNLRKYPMQKDKDYVLLYDNGDVTKFSDEKQPFAVVTHYIEIPSIT